MSDDRRKTARTHQKVEWLSVAGIQERLSPAGLIVYAGHFLAAAKSAEKIAFNPARAFLVCRALELGLKAFLSLEGLSLEALAKGPRAHDLENLLVEAQRRNLGRFIAFDEFHHFHIVRASKYYLDKVLEYPALAEAIGAYPDMPDSDALVEACDALVDALRDPCLEAS